MIGLDDGLDEAMTDLAGAAEQAASPAVASTAQASWQEVVANVHVSGKVPRKKKRAGQTTTLFNLDRACQAREA